MILDSKNYIFKIDSKTGVETEVPITKEERIELINKLCKLPGEQGLDERIFIAKSRALESLKNGSANKILGPYAPKLAPKTKDWLEYWNKEKRKCYSGLLIDDVFYITGDTYFYLNYTPIPDKVKNQLTYPRVFDTDIWLYQHIELAELQFEFTVTPKKRQIGVTLKYLAKILKRFWFESGFSGKVVAWDEKYVKEAWKILELYKDHLHTMTPWKRPIIGGKLEWTQAQLMQDGTRIGLLSALKGITFKNNPAAVVSGKTDEIFADELGIAPNADEMLEFVRPALTFGDITTGNFHGAGAVGRLKDCKPLKDWSFNPADNNFHNVPNFYNNNPEQKVTTFIPEEWSYGSYMDEFGNSLIEEAKAKIKELADNEKNKSFKAFMLYKSQRPSTLEDAFASREENDFPVEIVQPHYDYLLENYKPLEVTLHEEDGRIFHKIGSKYPEVKDFPVNKHTIKHGAVILDEAPISNPPFGLYYAGVDTITPIKTESISVQAIYIYKAAHQINGEYHKDKIVAWYAGRTDNPIETYEITLRLIKYYNARALIENNNRNFITWIIEQKMQKYMMKRSEVPIGKDLIMKTTVDTSDYGLNVKGLKEYLIGLLISYVEEEVETSFTSEGKAKTRHGVERIPDMMLLKEMLDYSPKRNVDRTDAMCLALLAAKTSTAHGLIVKNKHEYGNSPKKSVNYKEVLRKSSFTKTKFAPTLLRNTLR